MQVNKQLSEQELLIKNKYEVIYGVISPEKFLYLYYLNNKLVELTKIHVRSITEFLEQMNNLEKIYPFGAHLYGLRRYQS